MSIELFERSQEISQIKRLLTKAENGERCVLAIEGMPGSGKTRIVHEATLEAEKASFTVSSMWASAFSKCQEKEDLGLLSSEARPQCDPVFITVDDAHILSSPPAFDALYRVTREAGSSCVVSLCSGTTNVEVERFLTLSDDVTRITLSPLCEKVVSEMAKSILDATPDAAIQALCEQTEGNPLLVNELLNGLREEGSVHVHDGLAKLTSQRLPRRIHRVTQRWLGELPEKARQLLQLAAALGNSFDISEVAEMQRETTAQLLPALSQAVDSGLLTGTGAQTAFQHELVRRAVAESTPAPVRDALRQEVAMVRARRETMPSATLTSRASPPARFSETGSLSVPTAPAESGAVLPDPTSRLVPALLLARATLPRPLTPDVAEDLLGTLMDALQQCDRQGTTNDRTQETSAPPLVTARRILELFVTDSSRARSRAWEILAVAGESLEADTLAAATVLSNLEWAAGNLAEGLRWGWESVHRISERIPPAWQPYPRLALAAKLADVGEINEAELHIATAREESLRLNSVVHAAAPAAIRARVLLQAGRLTEARNEGDTGLAHASEPHSRWMLPFGQAVRGMIALRSGQLTAAADHVWRCRAEATANGTVFPTVHFAWSEFLVAAAQLDHRRAAELLTTEHADLLTERSLFIEEAGAAAWLVRVALSGANVSLATSVTAVAEELAAANPAYRTLAASATHARGLLAQDADALRQAAEEHHDPWAKALAEEDLGRLLATRPGEDGKVGVRSLRAALARLEKMGATADAARVREHLELRDVSPRDTATTALASGWKSLTNAERKVARLVSEGLTNRQVARRVSLSPHTVNYHLRAVFRKLGIRTRVELARHSPYELEDAPGHD